MDDSEYDGFGESVHLLDIGDETDGFSATETRNAFLRFFVSLLQNYEKFLPDGSMGEFQHEEFVKDFTSDGNCRVWMSKVVSSQMFERFIEERISDPDQPEVLFFDESIIAKNNRSRLRTVKGKGKKTTPFLSDQSGAVTDTFTPPAPSNWGLPDDGRTYHYVSFPKLDRNLFGKVRPPKQWDQIKKKRRRGASKAALKQQQAILSKALAAMGPNSEHGKRGPAAIEEQEKDVEWAIHALAYRDTRLQGEGNLDDALKKKHLKKTKESPSYSANTPSVALGDLPKAHSLILAARRKQSIQLAMIVNVQRLYRMYVARRRYDMLRRAVITLQRQHRKSPEIQEVIVSKYERIVMNTVIIQRIFRGYSARMFLMRHLRAAILIQTWFRCVVARRAYVRLLKATELAQAIFRGRRVRFTFKLTILMVSKIQGLARGWITRRRVSMFRKARAKRYRLQIYTLWRRARTPLSYRSRFWQLVNGSSFLDLSILEDELRNLWGTLHVDFPELAKAGREKRIVDPIRDVYVEGANVSTYNRHLLVQAKLDAARDEAQRPPRGKQMKKGIKEPNKGKHKNDKDDRELVPVFSAELGERKTDVEKAKSRNLRRAATRLAEEKMQIYESLDTHADQAALSNIYGLFGILSTEKKKKQRFVEALWETYYPDESMKAYFFLFPQFEGIDGVSYMGTPSKKAQKRFGPQRQRKSGGQNEPQGRSLWVQAKIDVIIKSNMKEVTTALISGLCFRKQQNGNANNDGLSWSDRQRNAIAGARPDLRWKVIRYVLVKIFIFPGSARLPPKQKRRSKPMKSNEKQPARQPPKAR